MSWCHGHLWLVCDHIVPRTAVYSLSSHGDSDSCFGPWSHDACHHLVPHTAICSLWWRGATDTSVFCYQMVSRTSSACSLSSHCVTNTYLQSVISTYYATGICLKPVTSTPCVTDICQLFVISTHSVTDNCMWSFIICLSCCLSSYDTIDTCL